MLHLKNYRCAVIAFALLLCLPAAILAQGAPSITRLSQSVGPDGTPVTITGTNFGAAQGASVVSFGSSSATTTSWSNTRIVAKVPNTLAAGSVDMTVTVNASTSNSVSFLVIPVITRVSPSSAAVGTSITITGSGFADTPGASTITFNGVSSSPTSWSGTSIVAPVPVGTTTGPLVVTVNAFATNSVGFTVPTPPPAVSALSPGLGPIGTVVTVTGANFGATQGSSAVLFAGLSGAPPATPTSWSATSVAVPVPNGAISGGVGVAVNGQVSNFLNFVVGTLSISSISPLSGPVGTQVSISGANFGVVQGNSSITFNGTPATVTSWSDTQIVASVPSGATTGSVVVSVSGAVGNGASFSVSSPLSSIIVTPADQSIATGTSVQFTATGINVDGTMQDVTANATWSSSLTGAATISGAGLANGVAAGQTSIQATLGSITGTTSLSVKDFLLTGAMGAARRNHTATLLNNGSVLVAGGFGANGSRLNSAELFNPAVGTFSGTGTMNSVHALHTATLLSDGKVLIAGGFDVNRNAQRAAELYDPTTGTFTPTGLMNIARASHTATLLNDGTVLIAGGVDSGFNPLADAEVFDPATAAFVSVGSLNSGRTYHTATLLNNGMVLVAGGYAASGNVLAGAELYDPAAGAFTTTGNLNSGRRYHTATLLNNGRVLIAGGIDANFNALAATELYDATSGMFTPTGNLHSTRAQQTATLLNNGNVLLTGGTDFAGSTFGDSELYDPIAGTFSNSGNLNIIRFLHAATLLTNGIVLFTGGNDSDFLPEATAESYQPATLTPPGLASIAVIPANSSVSVGLAQSFTATGTFGDGSTQVLSSVLWASSSPSLASVTNDSSNRGHVFAVGIGSASITACAGTICGSTSATLAPPALVITSLLPSSGAAGTVVSISGTGFGSTQGNSSVTFNGTPATVASWRNTGIIVTVPAQTASGNVVVTVSNIQSNSVLFTMLPAPTITSLSPTSGPAGTSVTISGSNFGSANGQSVRFNGVEAAVSSWTDTTILTTVPGNATDGLVIVTTADGLVSNGVGFTVPLTIISLEPMSGPMGTTVAITGSSFGANQGTGTVTVGGTPLQVFSWTDTQIVGTVGMGTTSGPVSVQQAGNTVSGPTFTISSNFDRYKIVPQSLGLLVGQSRTVSVTDNSGQVVHGLNWTTSDPTIVSLSTDDPPVITGVAPGAATVYAGGVPIPVTVYAGTNLPPGAQVWSLPINVSTPANLVPAVPSESGVDVFALDDDGMLNAVSSDGEILWSIPVPGGRLATVIPDFSGNAFLSTPITYFDSQNDRHDAHILKRIDPVTHTLNDLYTFIGKITDQYGKTFPSTEIAIPDTTGVLFVQDNAIVSVLNPATGQALANIPLEHSQYQITFASTCCPDQGPSTTGGIDPVVGHIIVAGDGNAYLPYFYFNQVDYFAGYETNTVSNLMVLRVSPDGTYAKIPVVPQQTWGFTLPPCPGQEGCIIVSAPANFYGCKILPEKLSLPVITNADVGAAIVSPAPICGDLQGNQQHLQLSLVSQDSTVAQSNTNLNPGSHFTPALQREDGSYIGTEDANNLIAVTLGGAVLWQTQPDPNLGHPNALTAQSLASDGTMKVSAVPYQPGAQATLYRVDADGNVTSHTPDTGVTTSWLHFGYSSSAGMVASLSLQEIGLAQTFAAIFQGNHSHTGTAIKQEWFPELDHCTTSPGCIGRYEAMYNALADLIFRLKDPAISAKAQSGIFDRLGADASGRRFTAADFVKYLDSRPKPRFYDGLHSTYCNDVLTGLPQFLCWNNALISPLSKVEDHFGPDTGALSKLKSAPMLAFFRPEWIGFGNLGKNLGNEGTIFHEALHGMMGQVDSQILENLGLKSLDHKSCEISLIIETNVLKSSSGLDPANTWPCN
jgi:hypothetical protein